MLLIGLEHLEQLVRGETYSAKAVLNEHGAIFFSVRHEHREMTAEGISYQDNYKGNALAAMLAPGRFEVRYHTAFPDARVREILRRLVRQAELLAIADWQFTYQGREVLLGTADGQK